MFLYILNSLKRDRFRQPILLNLQKNLQKLKKKSVKACGILEIFENVHTNPSSIGLYLFTLIQPSFAFYQNWGVEKHNFFIFLAWFLEQR